MIVFILGAELGGLEGSKSHQVYSSRFLILLLRTGGKREDENEMNCHGSSLSFGGSSVILYTLLSTNRTEENALLRKCISGSAAELWKQQKQQQRSMLAWRRSQ